MYSSPPSSSDTQAAFSTPPGCLRRFLIPILAVLITSSLLVFGLSKIEIVQAESPALSVEQALNLRPGISALFTPEVHYWGEEIMIWSETYQLDPNLVATVMQIESCGFLLAESGAGAKGLFQVMPYHFHEGENPFQPDTNAKRGLQYLRQAKEAGGNSRLSLAGYNGGINGATLPEGDWPEETHRYVYWGLRIYEDATNGLDHSARLDEWLAHGGASLCQKARESQD
jgi:soluble lytic murein transglycosylase-like protein